jgi:hypothetical protein
MATVVNDLSVALLASGVRYAVPTDRALFMSPETAVFKVAANGLSASPSSFTFKPTLLNMAGTVSYTMTGGIALTYSGNDATLNFASFSAVSGTITASVTVDGVLYSRTIYVSKVADGAAGGNGNPGPRGNVDISAITANSAWSDAEAVAALTAAGYGAPQSRDIVNLYKADRTWAAKKIYTGSAWQDLTEVFNSIFVKQSVLAEAINARGLDILAPDGTIILKAGGTLAEQVASNPNILESLPSWTFQNPAWMYTDTTTPDLSVDGFHAVFRAASDVGDTALNLIQSRNLKLAPNTKYTLSFRANTNASLAIRADVIAVSNGAGLLGDYFGLAFAQKRYFVTWTTGAQPELSNCIFRVFGSQLASQVLLFDFKLERGDTVTAWCDSVVTPENAVQRVAPNAIGNTQIGGDLFSTNWNWAIGPTGTGWRIDRGGSIWCNNLYSRGSIMGGSYTGWAWPASGLSGYYLGPEGLLLGNRNDNKFFQAYANGDWETTKMSSLGGILRLDGALIVNPQVQTNFAISVPEIYMTNQVNTGSYVSYGTLTAAITNGVAPFRYQWTFNADSGDVKMVGDPAASSIQIQGRGTNVFNSAFVTLTVYDANGAVASDNSSIRVQHGSGIAN